MKENNILIYYYQNNSNLSHVQVVQDYLRKKKVNYYVIGLRRNNKGFYHLNDESKHIHYTDYNLVLSIGGDGTLLYVANEIKKYNIPIIGINKGKLGFLTWFDCDNVCSFFDDYFEGNYVVEKRMMLDGHINKNGRIINVSAFNEIAVTKYVLSTPIDIGLSIDGKFLSRIKGDGVIVSTPTGSTGYSLSSGGPIISPLINAIIITPICPHSFTMKPIVIKDNHVIVIKLLSKKKAIITMDGQRGEYLKAENEIKITRSKYNTFLVRKHDLDFFNIISRKLKWGQ